MGLIGLVLWAEYMYVKLVILVVLFYVKILEYVLKFGLGSMEIGTDWVELWKGLVSLSLWPCMEVMLKGF